LTILAGIKKASSPIIARILLSTVIVNSSFSSVRSFCKPLYSVFQSQIALDFELVSCLCRWVLNSSVFVFFVNIELSRFT